MNIRENEKSMLIEEHEYDGIKELDNNPPPWIMWVFYVTVIWGFGYLGYYLLWKGNSQDAEYANEIAEAKSAVTAPKSSGIDENNIVLVSTDNDIESGRQLYAAKTCATCHGAAGEGNQIGPNLTDNAWIHGNTPNDVFKTIKHGYPANGMLAQKDNLTDKQILEVTSYILVKLKGSNPSNAKEPQGTVYK